MENRKINLSNQVLYLGTIFQNSEINKINISSKDTSQKIIYYFCYDDQRNKKLTIYELINQNNSKVEQKIKYEIKYKEDIGNNNIHLIAKANLNNKIYLIFINDNPLIDLYAGIYDLEINKYFPIIIDNSNTNKKLKEIMREIPDKDYITILEQNKIFFFGGLIAQTKLRNNLLPHVTAIPNEEESKRISSRNDFLLNKSSIYFDIEKLDFEKQKFPENSLIPRYKLGGTSENGILYLLGGFTEIPNSNEENNNIYNYLQFTRLFDGKMHQFNIAKIEGENPKDMVDCDVFMIKNKFLISFSAFKYAKIWFFDILKNKGINIDLKEKIKFEELNTENTFLRLINCDINEINGEMNIIIAKILYDENNIKLDIINNSFQLKNE